MYHHSLPCSLSSQYGEIYNFPSTAFENVLDAEELEEEEEEEVIVSECVSE